MKKLILFLSFCFLFFGMKAQKKQTTQDYLQNCIKEEREKGARTVIVIGNICSACRPGDYFYEGLVFTLDTLDIGVVKHFEYIDNAGKIEIIKKTIFNERETKPIFKIVDLYHDSLFYELSNLSGILTDTIIENGHKYYSIIESHGMYRFFGLYHNGKTIYSLEPITDLNDVFVKAHYYWLLHSAINNYKIDFLSRELIIKKR